MPRYLEVHNGNVGSTLVYCLESHVKRALTPLHLGGSFWPLVTL